MEIPNDLHCYELGRVSLVNRDSLFIKLKNFGGISTTKFAKLSPQYDATAFGESFSRQSYHYKVVQKTWVLHVSVHKTELYLPLVNKCV